MQQIQDILFLELRKQMTSPGQLADELSRVLGISKDSAYRRLKGEKQLHFDELVQLAEVYNLSLDGLLGTRDGDIVFQGDYVDGDNFDMDKFIGSMLMNLGRLESLEKPELIYVSKDLPVFYYLMFPEVAAFKFFVWTKTQMQFENMKEKKFNFDLVSPALEQLSLEVARVYSRIPSSEILNPDNIVNDLRQLEYYKETMLIEKSEDYRRIYEQLHRMIGHMEQQAALGYKFMPGEENEAGASYKLYVNDFYVGDNTIIAKAGDLRLVYVNHAAINFMHTTSREFVGYNEEFMNNLVRKSTLISEVGERTRTRFFHLIHERISLYSSSRN